MNIDETNTTLAVVTMGLQSELAISRLNFDYPWRKGASNPQSEYLRRRSFLQYVLLLPQPQLGIALQKLLGILPYRKTLKKIRSSTPSFDLYGLYMRSQRASTRRTEHQRTGKGSTTNT